MRICIPVLLILWYIILHSNAQSGSSPPIHNSQYCLIPPEMSDILNLNNAQYSPNNLIPLNNSTNQNLFDNDDIIPLCTTELLLTHVPILRSDNITQMTTFVNQVGLTQYSQILDMMANNRSWCTNSPTQTIGFLCSWGPTFQSIANMTRDSIYDSHSEKVHDMSDSIFAKLAIRSVNSPLNSLSMDQFRQIGSVIFPNTLADLSSVRLQYIKSPVVQFYNDGGIMKVGRAVGGKLKSFIFEGEFDRHLEDFKESEGWQLAKSHWTFLNQYYHAAKDLVSETTWKLSHEIPKIMKNAKSMIIHYDKLNKDTFGQAKGESILNQYIAKGYRFSESTYRNSPMFFHHTKYHIFNETTHDHRKFWTGWDDSSRKLYLYDINDLFRASVCGFCWLLRQDCCNETGCNLGFPYWTIADGVNCFYPQLVPPPPGWSPYPTGVDPNNPKCEDVSTLIGWIRGFSWVVTQRWLGPLISYYVGWQKWGSWFTYNLAGTIPPNLYICLVIKAFYGAVYVVSIGVFVILAGVILNILKHMEIIITGRPESQSTTPTIGSMLQQNSQAFSMIKTSLISAKRYIRSRVDHVKMRISRVMNRSSKSE